MRLRQIFFEAGMGRREFLKRSSGAVLSTLLAQGIPLDVAKQAASGKELFAIINMPGWGAKGTTGWSPRANVEDRFRDISLTHSYLKRIGASPIFSDGPFDMWDTTVNYIIPLNTDTLSNIDMSWGEKGIGSTYGDNRLKVRGASLEPPVWVVDGDGFDLDEMGFEPDLTIEGDIPDSFLGKWDAIANLGDSDNPFIDFWNIQASNCPITAINNPDFVRRLVKTFGDKLKGIQLDKVSPWAEGRRLPWDKFEDFLENPGKYLKDKRWGVKENPEAESEPEPEPESESEPEPYDEYDKYLMATMGNEGGFAMESKLFMKALNEALNKALR